MFASKTDNFSDLKIISFPFIKRTGQRYILNNDGSIGILIKIGGINRSGLTYSDYSDLINHKLKSLIINEENPDITYQFMQLRRVFIDFPEITNAPTHILERNRFARSLVDQNQIFKDHLFVAVTVFPSSADEGMGSAFKKMYDSIQSVLGRTDSSKVNDHFDKNVALERISRLDASVKNLEEVFFSMNVTVEKLNSLSAIEQVFALILRNTYNVKPRTEEDLKQAIEVNNNSTAQEIMMGLEANISRKYFTLDEMFHRSYVLDKVDSDEDLGINSTEVISNAPFEFNYMVTYRVLETDEVKQKLKDRVKSAYKANSVANGNETDMAKVDDELLKAVDDAIDDKRLFITEKGGVETNVLFTYREPMSDIEAKVMDSGSNILNYISQVDKSLGLKIFSHIQRSFWKPVDKPFFNFMNTLPCQSDLNSFFIEHHLELPTPICAILPVFADKREDMEFDGFNHLYNDKGTLYPVDHLDKRKDSFVEIVVGPMGSGKSVYLNHKISEVENNARRLNQVPLVRIIDWAGRQGSFGKRIFLKDIHGNLGKRYNFNTGNLPKVNVFDLTESSMVPTPEKVKDTYTSLYVQKITKEEDPKKGYDLVKKIFDLFLSIETEEFNTPEKIKERKIRIIADNLLISTDKAKTLYDVNFLLKLGNSEPNNIKMHSIKRFLDIMFSNDIDNVLDNPYSDKFDKYIRDLYRANSESKFPYLKARLLYILGNILDGNVEVLNTGSDSISNITSYHSGSKIGKEILAPISEYDKETAEHYFYEKSLLHLNNREFLTYAMEGNILSLNERILSELERTVRDFSPENNARDRALLNKIKDHEFVAKVPVMSDLKNLILYSNTDTEGNVNGTAMGIVSKLELYCRGGTYEMFDYQTELSFEHDNIIFDFQGLADDKRLSAIYSLLIIQNIKEEMYNKLDRIKAVFIDEAKFSLDNQMTVDMIAEFMRTSRKYAFSLTMASQSYDHFYSCGSKDIVSLASSTVFCALPSQQQAQVQGALRLNEGEMNVLRSSGVKEVPYGLIRKYSVYGVVSSLKNDKKEVRSVRHYLSPFEANLYSSSPEENDIISFFVHHKGMEVEEAIFTIINKEYAEYENSMIDYLNNKGNGKAIELFKSMLRKLKR